MKRGIRKCLTFVIRQISSNIVGIEFRKYSSSPRVTEQIQILQRRRIEYFSTGLKVTVLWIALKVFSMYLGGNCRWAPMVSNFL